MPGRVRKHLQLAGIGFADAWSGLEASMTFSYKLREGIAQNMNACFLMKKMGLIIND